MKCGKSEVVGVTLIRLLGTIPFRERRSDDAEGGERRRERIGIVNPLVLLLSVFNPPFYRKSCGQRGLRSPLFSGSCDLRNVQSSPGSNGREVSVRSAGLHCRKYGQHRNASRNEIRYFAQFVAHR